MHTSNPFISERELLVFDLDGTLLDTLPDIIACVNHLRARYERVPLTSEDVRRAVGDGARVLLERTLGEVLADGKNPDRLFDEFLGIYRVESLRDPQFYPGAHEFLTLTEPDHVLAVLTNKPLAITEPLLDAVAITDLFASILAPENARARKPDPAGLEGLLEQLGVAPEDALLIGDSTKDFATGRAAGVVTVGMRGGYYNPGEPDPDFWAQDFDQLAELWRASR